MSPNSLKIGSSSTRLYQSWFINLIYQCLEIVDHDVCLDSFPFTIDEITSEDEEVLLFCKISIFEEISEICERIYSGFGRGLLFDRLKYQAPYGASLLYESSPHDLKGIHTSELLIREHTCEILPYFIVGRCTARSHHFQYGFITDNPGTTITSEEIVVVCVKYIFPRIDILLCMWIKLSPWRYCLLYRSKTSGKTSMFLLITSRKEAKNMTPYLDHNYLLYLSCSREWRLLRDHCEHANRVGVHLQNFLALSEEKCESWYLYLFWYTSECLYLISYNKKVV